MMLFAGRSHPALATAIAARLGTRLGPVQLETFSNSETYCRYEASIRGADVFIIQTGCAPVDRNLMELLLMIQAARLGSAARISAVMPLMPYARQDRKARPREPISARLVADQLQRAGADRVLTMDLHAGQIQGFFRVPVDHMTAITLFAQHFRRLGLHGPRVVSVAPDAGRAKQAVRFAGHLDADFAIVHKIRRPSGEVGIADLTGTVRDKIALVGDDVIMTGGTLLAVAERLRQAGAREVWLFATHGVFCGDALDRFAAADLDGIVVTDTVPLHGSPPANLTVVSVADLLGRSIEHVVSDRSVSAIFGPDDQLS